MAEEPEDQEITQEQHNWHKWRHKAKRGAVLAQAIEAEAASARISLASLRATAASINAMSQMNRDIVNLEEIIHKLDYAVAQFHGG